MTHHDHSPPVQFPPRVDPGLLKLRPHRFAPLEGPKALACRGGHHQQPLGPTTIQLWEPSGPTPSKTTYFGPWQLHWWQGDWGHHLLLQHWCQKVVGEDSKDAHHFLVGITIPTMFVCLCFLVVELPLNHIESLSTIVSHRQPIKTQTDHISKTDHYEKIQFRLTPKAPFLQQNMWVSYGPSWTRELWPPSAKVHYFNVLTPRVTSVEARAMKWQSRRVVLCEQLPQQWLTLG